MACKDRKRREEKLNRRIKTITKKVYELGKYDNVEVVLFIIKNDRFTTYRSVDHESWPPSMKQIVSLYVPQQVEYTKLNVASLIPYS
jgi:hypothetical protein